MKKLLLASVLLLSSIAFADDCPVESHWVCTQTDKDGNCTAGYCKADSHSSSMGVRGALERPFLIAECDTQSLQTCKDAYDTCKTNPVLRLGGVCLDNYTECKKAAGC